jgi:hypothetical protein
MRAGMERRMVVADFGFRAIAENWKIRSIPTTTVVMTNTQ